MKNLFFLSFFIVSACKGPLKFKELPQGPIKHQLIVAAQTKDSLKARGLAGSTPAGTSVYFESGLSHKSVVSNKDGSFMLELAKPEKDPEFAEFHFTLPSEKTISTRYALKNLDQRLEEVVQTLSGPPEITHVQLKNNNAFILAEKAALLRRIKIKDDWTLGENLENILLNPQVEASPSFQSFDINNNYALISLLNANKLALLDLENNKIVKNFEQTKPHARSPQHILALDNNNFIISFINFNSVDNTYDFGALALVNINNNSINNYELKKLPCKNPYAIKAFSKKELWVSCSGAYTSFNPLKSSDAALVKIKISEDNKSFSIDRHIELDNFIPADFDFVNNNLVVPEAWGNRILVFVEDSKILKPENYISASFTSPFQFTIASHWHDDILMLGDASGALVAYSLSEGFFPFPFIKPLRLQGEEQELKLLPHQIMWRHKVEAKNLEDNYVGYNAWVISQAQDKIIALDFLKIFGP